MSEWAEWVENFVRFHKIIFQTDAESFSFLFWKTKKVLFLKKYNLVRSLSIDQESSNRWRLLSQFSVKVLHCSRWLCAALSRFYIVVINIDKKFSILNEVKCISNQNPCFIRFLNTFVCYKYTKTNKIFYMTKSTFWFFVTCTVYSAMNLIGSNKGQSWILMLWQIENLMPNWFA